MSYASLTPFERHRKLIHDYVHLYRGKLPEAPSVKATDLSIMEKNHRFIRSAQDDASKDAGSDWEARMAAKYYSRLFKEYALVDLSRYREGKIGMRWRVEKEVVSGKGQFVCCNLACKERDRLSSYEVNFCYVEDSQKKNALVKVRLCHDCTTQMNYKREKALVKLAQNKRMAERKAEEEEKKKQRKRRRSGDSGSDGGKAGVSRTIEEEGTWSTTGDQDAMKDSANVGETRRPDADEVWQSDAAAGINFAKATATDVDAFLDSMFF